MLTNFFKLDNEPQNFEAEELVQHFKRSTDLRHVYYKPDKFPPELRRCKKFTFSKVSLSKTLFEEMTFIECEFVDCLFIGSKFKRVEFHRCKFINCNFYKATFEECYIDPMSIQFDKSYRKTAANIGVHIYKQLHENSSRARQTDFAMKADIQFRRWKRWQLAYDLKVGKITRLQYDSLKWTSLLYEWIAGFGYMPLRFIVATILAFTFFSLVNMHILPGSITHQGEVVQSIEFFNSVFFTYSMMTALGFSSIVPITEFAKVVSVIEALIGIGWLGVFTSVLVKRVIK